MDIDAFWQLIERTRKATNGDNDKQANLLVAELVELGMDAILHFDHIQRGFMSYAYDCALWDAAYCIESCGDDSFMDFRAWLIAQGKQTYEMVVTDPRKLIDVVEIGQETQSEHLLYVANYAFEKVAGHDDMPPIVPVIPELKGKFADHCWERYPEIYAKFRHQ